MTRLIAVLATPEVTDITRLTQRSVRTYSARVGAALIYRLTTNYTLPHFEKYRLLQQAAARGVDQFLYLDADVYIKSSAPDIFAAYRSAAFNELPHPNPHWLQQSIHWIEREYRMVWPTDRYFNTGVLLLCKTDLQKLAPDLASITPKQGKFFEQDQLNWLLWKHRLPQQQLAQPWNQFCGPNWLTPEKLQAAYFLHGNGLPRSEKFLHFQQVIHELSKLPRPDAS